MNRKKIDARSVRGGELELGPVELYGWVRTVRDSKNVTFVEVGDGTAVAGVQVVFPSDAPWFAEIRGRLSTGTSVRVEGELIPSPAPKQKYEVQGTAVEVYGEASPVDYPLQKKGHSLEFLREILHLRPRSNTLGAVFRVRSVAALAVHRFFEQEGFYYVHTPIITASDCEGGGDLFKVTTLDIGSPPRANGAVDYNEDFFRSPTFLTVSGQLEAEIFATALSKVYTFGPTFRAENSNTSRHLAEFWMIEPEVAFANLTSNRELAARFVKFVIREVLERCPDEMAFFDQWIEKGIVASLDAVSRASFEVLEYTEAIDILLRSGKKFEFPVAWGVDLQSEHERYLTDEYIKGPVFLINYPREIKAFYMRANDDRKTVAAMDLLVPRLGEIIGGSQREEREDVLRSKIAACGLEPEHYWWYLELRRFGTVPHAGFGLGFERLVLYLTGMQNIRDVIPVPRFPGYAKF